jgi:hypothetical protein
MEINMMVAEKAGGPDVTMQAITADRADPILDGILGAQVAKPPAVMQHVVQEYMVQREISRLQMQQLQRAIEVALTVAKQSQQISRLAGGRLRQSHERLSLDVLINDALDQRADLFQQRGVKAYRKLRPIEVIVDPGLLTSLVDAAIEWACEFGRRLVVTLEMKNWPEYGMFVVKASENVAARGIESETDSEYDGLSWYLLTEIGKVMAVSVERDISSDESILIIEFARTVKQLEGLTAVELDGGGDSSMQNHSKPLAGHRVLIVTMDDHLLNNIKIICRSMGLIVDAVPTSQQAVRFCEQDVPHMIIIDERLHDATILELREDLHRTDPNYSLIEIAMAPNTLEVASWVSGSMTRVNKDALVSQLPSIMVLELAKVM